MKDGKSGAVSSIASDASHSDIESKVESVTEKEDKVMERMTKITVVDKESELIDVAHDISEKGRMIERRLCGVEGVAERSGLVEAKSVASVEEYGVAVPVVKLPVPVAVKREGSKKRRVKVSENEEEEVKRNEMLIAPLGPRDWRSGLMRRAGREGEFEGAYPWYDAWGGPFRAAPVGLSRGTDARRQSPRVRGGYLLRSRISGYGYGYRGRGRGRGV